MNNLDKARLLAQSIEFVRYKVKNDDKVFACMTSIIQCHNEGEALGKLATEIKEHG